MRSLSFIWIRKLRRAAFVAFFIALALTFPVARTFSAQKSRAHRPAHRRPAATSSIRDCGQGMTLHLSAPESTQGSLLLLELRSGAKLLGEVKALGTAEISLSGNSPSSMKNLPTLGARS